MVAEMLEFDHRGRPRYRTVSGDEKGGAKYRVCSVMHFLFILACSILSTVVHELWFHYLDLDGLLDVLTTGGQCTVI